MKKLSTTICIYLALLTLLGCQPATPSWSEGFNSIEKDMTHSELVALMGEPHANIGSGAVIYLYILSDEYVTVVSMYKNYDQEGVPLCVGVKPRLWTYEEFKEKFKYYPDDPNAWWND